MCTTFWFTRRHRKCTRGMRCICGKAPILKDFKLVSSGWAAGQHRDVPLGSQPAGRPRWKRSVLQRKPGPAVVPKRACAVQANNGHRIYIQSLVFAPLEPGVIYLSGYFENDNQENVFAGLACLLQSGRSWRVAEQKNYSFWQDPNDSNRVFAFSEGVYQVTRPPWPRISNFVIITPTLWSACLIHT